MFGHESNMQPNDGKFLEDRFMENRREESEKGPKIGAGLEWCRSQPYYDPVGIIIEYTLNLTLQLHWELSSPKKSPTFSALQG